VTARGRLLVPAVLVVNAAVQALLVIGDPTPALTPAFVLGALVSGLAWLVAYALIVARVVAPASVRPTLRESGARFAMWTVGLAVAVLLLLMPLAGVLGLLLMAATPYLPIAAMSGEANALTANLRAIRRAPWGFAWRLVVFGILIGVVLLAVALNAFFVTGVLAAFVNSLVLGAVGWVITRSFGHEYRVAT
jgi:hypothetical protein